MRQVDFATAGRFIWRAGAVDEIAANCQRLAITKPLLVTDAGLVKAGIVDRVVDPLRKAGMDPMVFSDIQADPPQHIVENAVAQALSADIDGVIGVGGGSSLDVAKLIAVLSDNSEQAITDIYGIDQIRGGRLPLILIPTTAGTGSEVTPISIITTGETTKSGVVSPQLLPDLAILDAELTLGLPPSITAATGIDAMVHAIEAFTSRHKKNLYSDMLAKEALRLLSHYLPLAVADGRDVKARSNMLLGAMMAGQAFANAPVAAVHALAYPLGGNYHIPHGLSNSLVLPHVLKFNAPDAAALYAELLPCITTESVHSELTHNSDDVLCDLFIEQIIALIDRVALPVRLRDLDVPKADLPRLAAEAMEQQRLLVNNPRAVSQEDALAIYQAAF